MAYIEMERVEKTFTVRKRGNGAWGAFMGSLRREKTQVRALQDLSFSISAGELVGYIGPNGAGKSTTVKVLSGILKADSGRCRVADRDPFTQRRAHVAELGVVFGQRSQLWWDNPVRDTFDLLRDIYGVPEGLYQKRLREYAAVLDVEGLLRTPVRQLSLGQRMRCELIASLLHGPRVLFLDEPTIGLDAVSKLALREFLLRMNRDGVTMILTTHDMDDIEALCSRVMVIGHGRLLYDGDLADLRRTYAPAKRISAQLSAEAQRLSLEGAEDLEVTGNRVSFRYDPRLVDTQTMVGRLAAAYPVAELNVEQSDVEEVVANLYREMAL